MIKKIRIMIKMIRIRILKKLQDQATSRRPRHKEISMERTHKERTWSNFQNLPLRIQHRSYLTQKQKKKPGKG